MPRLDTRRLERILKAMAKVRLLVVGDVVLDEYLRGDAERVTPDLDTLDAWIEKAAPTAGASA